MGCRLVDSFAFNYDGVSEIISEMFDLKTQNTSY